MFVGALLAQQDAFLNLLRIARGADSADPNGDVGATDPVNTLLVLLTFLALAALTVWRRKAVLQVFSQNRLSLALAAVAFLSVAWSVEPALTAKKAFVYMVSLWLPFCMAARLGLEGAVRSAAGAFAIAAVGSLLVGALVPSVGVMHVPGLEGMWRGVFTHKNPLAQSMLLGAMLEAYLLTLGPRRRLHAAILAVEILLILLSRSFTALVVASLALSAFALILGFRRGGQLRRVLTFVVPFAVAAITGFALAFPDLLQQVSGKDATLTGRTELWSAVIDAILERPFTGWGFQAFWDPDSFEVQQLWADVGWKPPNSHNGFLEVALGLGLMGFLLTVSILAAAVVRGVALMRDKDAALAGSAVLIVTGGVLVGSFSEAVLARQSIDWVVLNLMSAAAAAHWLGARSKSERERSQVSVVLRRARPI